MPAEKYEYIDPDEGLIADEHCVPEHIVHPEGANKGYYNKYRMMVRHFDRHPPTATAVALESDGPTRRNPD